MELSFGLTDCFHVSTSQQQWGKQMMAPGSGQLCFLEKEAKDCGPGAPQYSPSRSMNREER